MTSRCAWPGMDPDYIDYHDQEWGVPVFEDRVLFECLCLEGQQAGLSWITILKKRAHYRTCFKNFDIDRVARMRDSKIEGLLIDCGLVRNRLKLYSIRSNAIACQKVRNEFGSFSVYIWSFVEGCPIDGKRETQKTVPASTPLSEALSKDLKRRGFKFVGTTICYAFMQAVGMTNDHTLNCFRYHRIKEEALIRMGEGSKL